MTSLTITGLAKTLNKKSDNSNLNAGYLPIFGSNYSNGDNAGVCYLNVNNSPSNSNSNIGGHLMF